MRFMVIVKGTKSSEAGALPSEELLAEMGKFNEDLIKAGVLLAGEGLQASSKGARVKFAGEKRTVTDGPFAETKELVAGFWLWKCASLQEAIEWVRRCPNPMPGEEAEIEIRQVFEPEDFSPHSGRNSARKLLRSLRGRCAHRSKNGESREAANQDKHMNLPQHVVVGNPLHRGVPHDWHTRAPAPGGATAPPATTLFSGSAILLCGEGTTDCASRGLAGHRNLE